MIAIDTTGLLVITFLILAYLYMTSCGSESFNNLKIMLANSMGKPLDPNYNSRSGASSHNPSAEERLRSRTGSNGKESTVYEELTPGDLAQRMYGLPDNYVKGGCDQDIYDLKATPWEKAAYGKNDGDFQFGSSDTKGTN